MILQRLGLLIAPVVILFLFGPTLIGSQRVAYRDVSHFYLPLFEYVAERTSNEWLPLWNPLDQTGVPLLGESTTSVLYPIRYFIFSLPLSTNVAMAWYIAFHLILCSFAARWAAIKAGITPTSATIAGIIYPLSGGVLFLYTNPPFLVGAAWMPFAIGSLTTRHIPSSMTRTLVAASAMAMMVLGGDPQGALHAMLVSGVVVVLRLFQSNPDLPRRAILGSLICAPILAALLAAPQILASVSWSSQSDRVLAEDNAKWTSPPRPGSHRHDAYQFSLAPWHAAELLTSNAFGRLIPQNTRISALIPGDGRMWTPTIYCGLLTFLALIASCRKNVGERYWFWIATLSLLLCFGHFGLVWFVQQFGLLQGTDSAIGGPYWILHSFLPGYDSFRYPTKWLPVFSLACAIVTAQWVDERHEDSKDTRSWLVVTGTLGTGLLIVILLSFSSDWLSDLAANESDELWGELRANEGLMQIFASLIFSLVALICIAITLFRSQHKTRSHILFVLSLLVAGELAFCHRSLIVKVPVSRVDQLVDESIDATKPNDQQRDVEQRWMRTRGTAMWPPEWKTVSSTERPSSVAASERLAWFGRWHLPTRDAVFNNMVSIQSNEMAMFWTATKQVGSQTGIPYLERWKAIRNWLGLNGIALVSQKNVGGQPMSYCKFIVENKQAKPFRLHNEWAINSEKTQAAVNRFITEVVQQDQETRPIIHTETPPLANQTHAERTSKLSWADSDNAFVEIYVPTLLTRCVFQDGHWIAKLRESGTSQPWAAAETVHHVSFLQQGVILPPGKWDVRFVYRPWWLTWSLGIASACWLAMIAWIGARVAKGLNALARLWPGNNA